MIRFLALAFVPILIASCASLNAGSAEKGASFAHDVYFELNDNTSENREALIEACWKHLSGIDGILFFACGTRDEDSNRDVNDASYDVSLHICFSSKAVQDVYQTHPAHLTFIEENASMWKSVRVFDSFVEARTY